MQACLHVTAHQRNTRNVTSRVFTTEVGEGAIRHLQRDLNIIPIVFLTLSLGNNFFESTQIFV